VLLLKFILAPLLIGLVSLAGRRWGPAVAGWLLGLPLNSGPILVFLLIEQGPQFTVDAARGTLLGILAWAAFCVTYAYCCVRMSWWWSTLIGWVAYAVAALVILPLRTNVVWTFVLVVLVLAVVLLTFPRPAQLNSPQSSQPRHEIWLRMASATAMVVALTSAAKLLGPTRSGILSAFPAYTTILAVFSHRQGTASAVRVLKGVSAGLYTAATFFLTLSLALQHFGGAVSFALAGGAALLVQGISLAYVWRHS
jgi:hypothetical protein